MKTIHIFGGGGHSFALVELIRSLGLYEPKAILDKNPSRKNVLGVPVLLKEGNSHRIEHAAIAIGNNKNRKKVANSITVPCPNFVHKSAVVYPSVQLGKGVQVLPNAVVDADVRLGDFTIVNNNASVSHNCIIGNFCHIAINTAISGGCTIGEGTLVGAGSVILPELNVGKWAVIGAGSVVTKDVPDFATVYGNPAQIIRKETLNGQ